MKRALLVGLFVGVMTFIIGLLIPESNKKEIIMPIVTGLSVLIAGLINTKYKNK